LTYAYETDEPKLPMGDFPSNGFEERVKGKNGRNLPPRDVETPNGAGGRTWAFDRRIKAMRFEGGGGQR